MPTQICNKCSAKLHISFQFKKQCERSDAKLRQYLANSNTTAEQQQPQQQHIQQQHEHQQIQHQPPQPEPLSQHIHQVTQEMKMPPTNNCLYVECAPLVDLQQDQNGFIQASQLNYNIQTQNHMPVNGYSIQTVAPVQVYNGGYAMPIQQMQPPPVLHNQVVTSMPVSQPTQPQPLSHHQQIIQPQPEQVEQIPESKEKQKRGIKGRKEGKSEEEVCKQCPTCNKIFPTTAKLSRHMKTHSTDMPYKCKVCNKAFSHSGNYKIHLRMHTDERPFKCNVCGKGCRQAQDLEKHMRTHTGTINHSFLVISNLLILL